MASSPCRPVPSKCPRSLSEAALPQPLARPVDRLVRQPPVAAMPTTARATRTVEAPATTSTSARSQRRRRRGGHLHARSQRRRPSRPWVAKQGPRAAAGRARAAERHPERRGALGAATAGGHRTRSVAAMAARLPPAPAVAEESPHLEMACAPESNVQTASRSTGARGAAAVAVDARVSQAGRRPPRRQQWPRRPVGRTCHGVRPQQRPPALAPPSWLPRLRRPRPSPALDLDLDLALEVRPWATARRPGARAARAAALAAAALPAASHGPYAAVRHVAAQPAAGKDLGCEQPPTGQPIRRAS